MILLGIFLTRSSSFHTTMVLTQRIDTHAKFYLFVRFHTTMVLTQPLPPQSLSPYHEFRFHTTMVLTQHSSPTRRSSQPLKRFHTTMVLTQPGDGVVKLVAMYAVSIPLWFSRNESSPARLLRSLSLVSIPLWFSRNAALTAVLLWTPIKVSIPLWFSRNAMLHDTLTLTQVTFPYHYGSHATIFDSVSFDASGTFPYHYGSHATQFVHNAFKSRIMFPYHYGSHATLTHQSVGAAVRSFHTTMVLTQRKCGGSCSRWRSLFPYHYGSHATIRSSQNLGENSFVSIPLWFSRNENSFGVFKPKSILSFHTTMVLTQPPGMKNQIQKALRFHTTMVLTQLNNFYIVGIGTLPGFHTTMVLTQRGT